MYLCMNYIFLFSLSFFLLSYEIFIFILPRASAFCTHIQGLEITGAVCQMIQLYWGSNKVDLYVASNLEIDGKKEITAECSEDKATHV